MPFDVDAIRARDDKLIAELEDMTPAMERLVPVVAEGIDKNFATESAAGEKWPELAWATQEERAREGYGAQGPILQRDGGVRAEATEIREYDAESMQVGAPDESVLKYHTGDGPRSKIPRREVFLLDEETAEKADAVIDAYLDAAEK